MAASVAKARHLLQVRAQSVVDVGASETEVRISCNTCVFSRVYKKSALVLEAADGEGSCKCVVVVMSKVCCIPTH